MINIKTHFKERQPEETISIIKNFFNRENYKIIEWNIHKSECGTYSNRIELYINDIYMVGANGKGMTEKYCLASSYGELYERFCDTVALMKVHLYSQNDIQCDDICNSTFENELNNSFIYNYYYSFLKTEQNIKELFKYLYKDFFDYNFINLYNNIDNISIDYRVMAKVIGSVGLAAGNTFTEAANQGLSEILEKYTSFLFFLKPQQKYHIIDKKYITNEEVLLAIEKLQKLNYDIYFVDLSYNFNTPVCMSLLINKYENNFVVNFGAFGDIDIVLERIVTELYQGVVSYCKDKQIILEPFYIKPPEYQIRDNIKTFSSLKSFPEFFFDNIEYGDYNHNIFLKNSNSNELIFNQLKNICNNLNYKVYYKDISLNKDITTLRIIIPEIDIFQSEFQIYKDISNDKIDLSLEYIKQLSIFQDLINKNYNNNIIINKIKNILLLYNNNIFDKEYINKLVFDDPLLPIGINPDGRIINILNNLFNNPNEFEYDISDCRNTLFYNKIKIYKSLQLYISNNKYSKQEIKKIFKIFNVEITDEDINNIFNAEYLYTKIFLEKAKEIKLNPNKYSEPFIKIIKEKIKNEISS